MLSGIRCQYPFGQKIAFKLRLSFMLLWLNMHKLSAPSALEKVIATNHHEDQEWGTQYSNIIL